MEKKNYEQSKKLDNVCYDIRGPGDGRGQAHGSARASSILQVSTSAIPRPFGFYAPDEVILDMIYNLRETARAIPTPRGLFSARKAIMQYCQLKGIPNVGIDDIFTGNGVSELITLTMQGLLDDGDESSCPRAGLSALDGVRHAGRRQSGALSLRRAVRLVPRT